ncbi:hypothetical protein [Deinococcus multiflagellatus]|uniref:Uncharacterized protein n=1 Tax=Deinococcus multiflagellatus TaxID=1656887 RepID=A0ABW1ZTK3_9DEIO|nr:hypothetical protein [Deinococcus multiflagellatus]MBZ9714380.1 hypothetical protein [Deinococcus multiflagellatus]
MATQFILIQVLCSLALLASGLYCGLTFQWPVISTETFARIFRGLAIVGLVAVPIMVFVFVMRAKHTSTQPSSPSPLLLTAVQSGLSWGLGFGLGRLVLLLTA